MGSGQDSSPLTLGTVFSLPSLSVFLLIIYFVYIHYYCVYVWCVCVYVCVFVCNSIGVALHVKI